MFPKETSNSMLRPRSISNNSIPNVNTLGDATNNNNSTTNANNSFNNQNTDQNQNGYTSNNNNNNNNNINGNNNTINNANNNTTTTTTTNNNNQSMSNKKIQWNKDYIIWLNPTALDKLREQLTNKKHLEFEVRKYIYI